MESIVVRRAGVRMWFTALGGVPLLVVGVDVVSQHRIVRFFHNLVFATSQEQPLGPRDYIWAWVFIVVGALLVLWGLKELVVPTEVVRADTYGLALSLGRPFRSPVLLPWRQIDDIGDAVIDDDGDSVPVLWVRVMDPDLLPEVVWNARKVDDRTVALYASDWEAPPDLIAREAVEWAVAHAFDEEQA